MKRRMKSTLQLPKISIILLEKFVCLFDDDDDVFLLSIIFFISTAWRYR